MTMIIIMIIIILTSCIPCTARAYTQHLSFMRYEQPTLAAKGRSLYDLSNNAVISRPTITILIYVKDYMNALLNV